MITFDHIAIAGETLAAATAHGEAALGTPFQSGGQHDVYGTHNTLLGVQDGLYVEAIAINPDATPERQPRWFDLDRFAGAPRVTNWICRCTDLDETLAALPKGFGTPVALSRGDLRWRMAVPEDGILPFDSCAPALIQWEGAAHPSERLETVPIRLDRLTIAHPHAADLEALLRPFLSDERIQFETAPPKISAVFEGGGERRIVS